MIDAADHGVRAEASTSDPYDNTTALQAALDASGVGDPPLNGNDLGHSIVQLPAGRIKVNDTVRIPANTTLRGHGFAGTYLVRSTSGTSAGPVLGITSGSIEQIICDLGVICQDHSVDCIDLTGSNASPSILADSSTTIRDVVCVGGKRGVYVPASAGTEHRFAHVRCYRQWSHGFDVGATDCFFECCTAAASGQANRPGGTPVNDVAGFNIAGANSRIVGCKAFGQIGAGGSASGSGFILAGAGRHQVSTCEAQDCMGSGFSIVGPDITLTACLSDSCGRAGFFVQDGQVSDCVVVNRGGAYAHLWAVNVPPYASRPHIRGLRVSNVGRIVANDTVQAKVATFDVHNRFGSQQVPFAATVTPNPWDGGDVVVASLTGNLTIANPSFGTDGASAWWQAGQELTFTLPQDATGGRTVSFGTAYKTTAAIPTTASSVMTIKFKYDGSNWREIARAAT
jgi:hypothetical protein